MQALAALSTTGSSREKTVEDKSLEFIRMSQEVVGVSGVYRYGEANDGA